MSLYDHYKTSVDKLFIESMSGFMEEGVFYDNMKEKFDNLDQEILGLDPIKAQKKISKSVINRILKVHVRVLLIRDLRAKIDKADNILQVILYLGLITYLYLTCFDQLGQPEQGWYFFSHWIKSKSNVEEVNKIVKNSIEKIEGSSITAIKDIVEEIYGQYNQIYGVRKSFFRFLREVVATKNREELLDSILVEKFTYEDVKIDDFDVDDEYKEKWLFNTRNNYTHNLFTTETNITPGKYIYGYSWLIREKIFMQDGVVVIWVVEDFNSILENCILHGIQRLIES